MNQIDYARIGEEALAIAATKPHGVEVDIVRLFVLTAKADKSPEDRIPLNKLDTIVTEMAFKFGRADIVVFHVDGSASVIEVKDGTKGYGHVIRGLGQAGLYAAQLGMANAGMKIRRCLLWTSTGNIEADGVIEQACEDAGVIALPWGMLSMHLACYQAVMKVVAGA